MLTTRRPDQKPLDRQPVEAGAMRAGAALASALGNQELADLTLPPPAPERDEDEALAPWLTGDEFRTADFLAGLRGPGPGSADQLVHSFPSSTW